MDNPTEFNHTVENTPPESGYNNNIQNNVYNPNTNYPNNKFNPGYINNNNNFYNNQSTVMAANIIDSLSGWMKFFGIFTLVIGVISCIGIFSAAIGIPLIFAGIALTNASKSLKAYKESNNPFSLNDFFTNTNKFFKIQGILAIIGIAFAVILIAILLIIVIVGMYSFSNIY